MKKIFIITFLGLFLNGFSLAEIREIEQAKIRFKGGYSTSGVTTICVDGYKYVAVRGPDAISVVQAFEIIDGKSLPAEC